MPLLTSPQPHWPSRIMISDADRLPDWRAALARLPRGSGLVLVGQPRQRIRIHPAVEFIEQFLLVRHAIKLPEARRCKQRAGTD